MAGPYRESDLMSIECPRCNRGMPLGEISSCTHDCGVWVTMGTAMDAFLPHELPKSRVTTWFRERAPCPHCSILMTLRGTDMALFQGCDDHGFWVDAETVDQTGLVRPTIRALVYAARDTARAMRGEQERRAQKELEARAQEAQALAAEVRARRARSVESIAAERAQEEEERRREAERAQKRKPYVELLQSLAHSSDVVPLAEHLLVLDETIDALWKRIAELERRR